MKRKISAPLIASTLDIHSKDLFSFDTSPKLQHLQSFLLTLLADLEFVEQGIQHHPEGNALFHSLQVYQWADKESKDPEMHAAALFHDIGKAIDYAEHDRVGAEVLEGALPSRVVWLVRHHLDLLVSPTKARRRYAGSQALVDLELLRRWDLAGRDPYAMTISTEEALEKVLHGLGVSIASRNTEA